MMDHVGFSVSDYERAKAFYGAALAPLGYTLLREVPAEKTEAGFACATRAGKCEQSHVIVVEACVHGGKLGFPAVHIAAPAKAIWRISRGGFIQMGGLETFFGL